MSYASMWDRVGRHRVRRRTVMRGGITLAAGSVAAMLAACGGDSSDDGAESGGATTGAPSSGTSAAETQATKGGTLNYHINADPPSLNLWEESTYIVPRSMAPIYNQLVKLNPMDESEVVADLAKSWEFTNDDKTEIVFKLQDSSVTWHDGKPFSAEDVKATYTWLANLPSGVTSPRTTAARNVAAVEVIDPTTVKFTLKEPQASFLSSISNHHYAMGAKHIIDQTNTLLVAQDKPIGTGPFTFKGYKRNNVIDLERNKSYWRADRPYLDAATCYIIQEPTTSLTNFLAGQLHLVGVNVADLPKVQAEAGDRANIVVVPSLSRIALIPNGTRPPFNDPRMREALSAAIDRDEFNKIIQESKGLKGSYNPPEGFWALPTAELAKFTGYGGKADVQKAKQLMAAAGFAGGVTGDMPARQDFEDNAIALQAMLKQAGFDFNAQIEKSAVLNDRAIGTQFDVLCHTWSTPLADPDDSFAEMIIHPDRAGRNWSKVITPEVDRLFDLQRVEFDRQARQKIVQDCDRAALGNYPNIIVMYSASINAIYNTLQDFKPHVSIYTNQRWEDVWLDA
ncbi:MAG: ABC transporter substrate-binding protein [Dehalococcoidia bacterium]